MLERKEYTEYKGPQTGSLSAGEVSIFSNTTITNVGSTVYNIASDCFIFDMHRMLY